MKKVLITLDYDPNPHKVAETGFSIAKSLGLGITLQHIATDELYYKLLDMVTIMGIYSQKKSSDLFHQTGVDRKELSLHFLNKSKFHFGNACVHTILKDGDGNESVLKIAKEFGADVIVIIMALHNRDWLQNRTLESVAENVSLNSSVPVLIIPTNKESIAIY